METQAAHDYWEHRGQYLLMTAFLLGPVAWGINELVGYALVKPVCANGHKILLTGVSLGTLAVAAAGIWIGWSCFAQLRGASDKGGTRVDRSHFLALVAIGFNALIALLIVTAAVSPLLLSPCE